MISKMVTHTTGYLVKLNMNPNIFRKSLMFDLHGIQDGDPYNRIPCKIEHEP